MQNGHQLNILLIETEAQDYEITKNLLTRIEDWQIQVEWQSEVTGVLEKLSTGDYTACLFNYDEHGWQFIEQAIKKGIKTPLISLTETESRRQVQKAMQAGAVDYLVKSQMTTSVLRRVMRYAIQYNQLMIANGQLKQEVTEVKRSEKKLRKEGQQYRMLFNVNIYAVEVMDRRGVLTDCNAMLEDVLGYSREALIGKPATDFMSERSKTLLEEKLADLTPESFVESEVEFVRQDGNKIMVWRRSKGIFNRHGKLTGLVAYSRDITERMKAVKQISILARALEQSSVSILIADYRGRIEYINFEFTELTGYTYEEVVGKHIRAFKLKHLPRELYEELWETINAGDEWRGEFKNYKKDKDAYWEGITVTPIYSSKGHLTHFVVIQANITHKVESTDEDKESQQRLGSFLSGQIQDLTALNEALQQEVEERTRAERALRRSRSRLKAQYKGIPVPTYSWQVTHEDYILVDYNNAAEKSSNGRVTNILGQKASVIFKDRPQVRADFDRCSTEKVVIKREAPYRLITTGETRHFVTTYNFVPPNLILVHIEDVTEHKNSSATDKEQSTEKIEALKQAHDAKIADLNRTLEAEVTARKAAEATLKETEGRMETVRENVDERLKEQYRGIPIPTYSWQMIGGEFILVDFNDAAAQSMGRIVDFFGKAAHEIFKDRAQVLDDFNRCYNEQQTVVREAPYTMITTGETKFFVTTYLYTPPNLVIVHIQDITTQKKIETELEQCKNQLNVLTKKHGPKVVDVAAALHSEIKKRQEIEKALKQSKEQLSRIRLNGKSAAKLLEMEETLTAEVNKRKELEGILEKTQTELERQTADETTEKLAIEVAKRQEAEQTVETLETRLTALADNIDDKLKEQYRGIPIPTYSWQAIADEFILVDFNDAAAESMGKIKDFFGQPASKIFKDRPQVLADFDTCYRERNKITREAPYTMITTGETRFFVTTYLFMPPSLIIVHIQDITQYKAIEEELSQVRAKPSSTAEKHLQIAKKRLQQEHVKRKQIEEQLQNLTDELQAVITTHEAVIKELQTTLDTEITQREAAEMTIEQLKQQPSHQEGGSDPADLEAVHFMNERLQQELSNLQRAEESTRQQRARLKAQYRGIPIPTYSWQRAGEDFILVDNNAAAEKASEGRIYDLMGTTASKAFKDRPQILADLERCFETESMITREAPYQLLPTDGDKHFVSTYCFVPTNLVVVYVQDVTAHKRVADEMEQRYAQITLQCSYTLEGIITSVSEAYCWYFNTERDKVLGQFVPFIHQDDREKVEAHFKGLRERQSLVQMIEYRVVKQDGVTRWQQWTTLPMTNMHGDITEIHGMGQDITLQKNAA